MTGKSPNIKLDDQTNFEALFDDQTLSVVTDEGRWSFEEDDLRGVWLSLMNGLVTVEKAGWTTSGGALPLLTLMRLLPDVRAVEIQRKGHDDPELAVELLPGAISVYETSEPNPQRELSWH